MPLAIPAHRPSPPEDSHPSQPPTELPKAEPFAITAVRQQQAYQLGPGGLLSQAVEKRRNLPKRQQFSMSLISAISYDEVLANQLVEGGVDTSVFDHFIYKLLEHVRGQRRYDGRPVVLLMDNATIHRHPRVVDTILGMRCLLLYNPQYSPHLNPVERYFKRVKKTIKQQDITSR